MTRQTQLRARWIAASLLFGLGVFTLHSFWLPMAWSVVLSITLWPLYDLLGRKLDCKGKGALIPALLMTLVLALVIYGPVTYGLLRVLREMQSLTGLLHQAQRQGIPAPLWLSAVPLAGEYLLQLWDHWLKTPEAIREMTHSLLAGSLPAHTRYLASYIVHRFATSFFMLLAFFFILLHGQMLQRQVVKHADQLFGINGGRYARHAASAVRATVNGIVLVALGQGIALGFGYWVVGFDHAALLGIATGIVALIPFAAKLFTFGAACVLISQGSLGLGVGFFLCGLLVVLLADNYVKPRLIGNQVQLPFLWTLLGILGGIETFGLLGLFLGPTIMAVLMSVWRDSLIEEEAEDALDHRE